MEKKSETFDNEMLSMGFVLIDYSVSVDEISSIYRHMSTQTQKTTTTPTIHRIRCSIAFLLCIFFWILWFRLEHDFRNELRHFLFIIHSPTNSASNDWRNGADATKHQFPNERNGLQSNAFRLLNVNVNSEFWWPECKHPDSREYYVSENCWNAPIFPLHF